MLDILFILLVFFMLTMGTVFQSLELKLPAGASEELSLVNELKYIMLEIRANGYAIDDKAIHNFEQLKAIVPDIIRQKSEHGLIIAGDKSVPIEQLLKVLTYLQSQGVEAANILIQSDPAP